MHPDDFARCNIPLQERLDNVLKLSLGLGWEKCITRWSVEQELRTMLAVEREKCARVADHYVSALVDSLPSVVGAKQGASEVAKAIRARGSKTD